jgi:large subunit ribosomal protein L25
MELTIECKTRPEGSKPNALRRAGLIPAVLYGHNGVESISMTVPAKAAELLVRDGSVNNTLFDITIPDQPWSGKALLREVHKHPWKGFLYHLSFFSVASQSSLEVDVPLRVVGEAPGVKIGGGSLELMLNQLRVQCAPDQIPEVIEVDISALEVGQFLHVGELTLPEGVVSSGEADRVVVTILAGGE